MNEMQIVRATTPGWQHAVLRFWFRELQPEAWFKKSEATDEAIRARFASLPADVRDLTIDQLATSAKEALAGVIALDQFPRNLFRGTAQAFAFDAHALALAQKTIALGYDRLLRKDERLFVYLPFEHSEDRNLQARCVELMTRLGDNEWTRYAEAHKVIIERFGRYPHRNAALGRASTAEEVEFLKQPGSSF